MRLLVVIGAELMGADRRSDWSTLQILVAGLDQGRPEIHVLALVNAPRASILFGHPLGRAMGGRMAHGSWRAGAADRYEPSESARQRLGRARVQLRRLGLPAGGDIGPGDPYRCVRRECTRRHYDRILLLVPGEGLVARLGVRRLTARLRRSLGIPVDVPAQLELAPPAA